MDKSKKDYETCYICGLPTTSGEHAPAKCFFPKDKRLNLIKVRSCSVHNENTSKDDEYVRNIIAMSIGNNNVSLNHFLKSCLKSFENSPKLLSSTTKISQEVYYKEVGHESINPTKAFQIERDRIDLVMRKIAYAIFFEKFGNIWKRELNIGTEYLRTEGMQTDGLGMLIQEAKKVLIDPVFEGTNPEVFKYSFGKSASEDINDQLLIMKFYEGFEVWVFPINGTFEPKI